jgi:hypothetical protein
MHFLLLPVQLTGNEQLVVKLSPKHQKHCATVDHAINRSQISPDFVQLKALGFPDLIPRGLLLLLLLLLLPLDGKEEIACLVTVAAWLALDLALQLLE